MGLPEYADEPKIGFDRFIITRNIENSLSLDKRDSVNIIINFEDGDGDLGIASEDLNTSEENIIVSVERKKNGIYSPLLTPDSTFGLNGRFPELSPSTDNRPIDGVLDYAVVFEHNNFFTNDTLRLTIYIIDQAGNKSNSILTDDLIIEKQ